MIAHRIMSVLDSDMVLVLEQGLIDEYDSPTKLLEDKSSSYAKLVAEYTFNQHIQHHKPLRIINMGLKPTPLSSNNANHF
ncbi:hypothetical protein LXL04_016170 [Taraxacum kok-saghyz]